MELLEQSLQFFDKAIEMDPFNVNALSGKSACLAKLKQPQEALVFASRSIELKPDLAQAWCNLGVALNDLKHYEEAIASHNRTILLGPHCAKAWSNRGVALNSFKHHDDALASYERAIEIEPDYAEAWGNRGNTLNDLKRHEEALASYERAIELKPDGDFRLGDLVHTQMKICDWSELEQRCKSLKERLLSGQRASTPLPVLGLFDDPELQKRCAEIYAKSKLSLKSELGVIARRSVRDKIRIGYFSMDFREHPVSYLLAELFELHDRSKFEVYGFSFGINTQDFTRRRIEKAFDKFLDVSHLSDLNITHLSRQHEIDIAIDLGGYTQDSRPQIFAERAAPVQINFLGYPGTWGGSCMDYFIGDKVAISDESRKQFSEKVIFLPNSFQPNPSHRPVTNNKSSRRDHGLSEESFVFCCFNNSWKITPEVFGQWIQILQQVPNGVLWLSKINSSATKNIRRTLEKNGLNNSRLIFAKRLPGLADHLARYQLADLFLDTSPYGAHTTASDALWTGVPVLTRQGQSFAARVAASLLTNIGVPELITHTKEEYFSVAVQLALSKNKLASIKAKLAQNRLTTPLFNTELFARHIECAYQAAYDRYHTGLAPDHIHI